MSECCSFVPEEAKKEEYTVYTDELAKEVGVDPRPNETLVEIDEFNDWLFPHINNSHYRMAFCQSPLTSLLPNFSGQGRHCCVFVSG